MRKIITLIIFITVFIAGSAFSAINTSPVSINYYLGTISAPLSVIVVISILVGIILGAAIITLSIFRLRYENRRLTKKLQKVEQEIEGLQVLSLNDAS